jgi:hypothetical protein
VAGFSTWVSRWPRSPPLELPLEEAETVAACLHYVEFLDREIAAVEALVAKAGAALAAAQARRLSGGLPPVSGCAKPARAEQISQPALPVARPSSSYRAELWLPRADGASALGAARFLRMPLDAPYRRQTPADRSNRTQANLPATAVGALEEVLKHRLPCA